MKPQDAALLPAGVRSVDVTAWREGQAQRHPDWLADEVPVALVFNGISHAVMMASPADLEEFALGFGLTEGGVIASRFFSGGAFLVGARGHGADEEDDARRDAENPEQKQQRQTVRPGREDIQGAGALCPCEIAPASEQRGAKQKLKNAQQHLYTPPQGGLPTYRSPWVGPGAARISRFPATPEP